MRPFLEVTNALKQSLLSDTSSRNGSHLTETQSSRRMAYSAKELSKAYFLGYKVRKIINGRRLKKLLIGIKDLTKEY